MNLEEQYKELVWERSISKRADYDLGDNPQLWVSKIRSIFEKQHPELIEAGGVPNISFYKKDFTSGNASGAITITVNTTYMVFPIIVREKALAPFDAVYVDKHWHYADKDLMLNLMQEYNLFAGMSDKPAAESYGTRVNPVSSFGRFVYPSSGSMTVLGSYAVTKEDREKIASFIDNNRAEYAYSTEAFKQFISKIATGAYSRPVDMAKPNPAEDFNVALIRQNDIDSYNVKLAYAGCEGYLTYDLDYKSTKNLLDKFVEKSAEKILDTVDANPGRGVLVETAPAADAVDPIYEQPGLARMAGSYNVITESGHRTMGIVYPMVSWDFEATPNKLFMNAEFWSVQPFIAGSPSSTAFIAPLGNLKSGSQGVFVYRKGGRAFSTPPVEIREVTMSDDGISIKACDIMDQKPLNLLVVKDIRAIMKIDPEKDPNAFDASCLNLYLPQEMEYIELPPTHTHIIQDPSSILKISSFIEQRSRSGEMIRILKDGSDRFVIDTGKYEYVGYPDRISKSANFVKWAHLESADPSDAAFRLACMGAGNTTKIAALLKNMESSLEMVLPFSHQLASRYVKENRIANMTKEASVSWEEIFEKTARGKIDPLDVLKIAAHIPDNATLDSVLSLNFLNKDTIEYFVSHSEMLNDLEEFLVKLLLSERVSSFGIDEDSILRTLKGLSEIQEGFKGLSGKG